MDNWNNIMFDNIGSKIKLIAKIIAWIDILICLICGVIMLLTALIDFDDSWYFLFLAPVIVIIGCFFAWLSVVILYGFGELIEKTAKNESNTRAIAALLRDRTFVTNKNLYPTPSLNTAQTAVNSASVKTAPVTSAAQAPFTNTQNNTIVCSACNFEQPGDRTVCWHCGAKFQTSSHKWRCDNCGQMRSQSPCEYCGHNN